MIRSTLSELLLSWYKTHARQLPWRENRNPYRIWVSEIMLQQTRVETVIPYFERWMAHFPTIEVLAQASQQDVLSAWEGLGYYSRARNLQRAAQVIITEYAGELPKDAKALRKLPGIGRYTAGAIASIAFGLDEPVLDGNIRRVLARVFNVDLPARSPAGENRLWELAEANLPSGCAGDYNQALMDLGATICTPRSPVCKECPLSERCLSLKLNVQEQRPVIQARPTIPHYIVTAGVIERQGKYLITQRPLNGLLGGLWEFPGGKLQPGEDLETCLKREICEELDVDVRVANDFGTYRHAYTHFRVTLHAFCCQIMGTRQPQPRQVKDLCWVSMQDLVEYPMGKIDRQIASRLLERGLCSS